MRTIFLLSALLVLLVITGFFFRSKNHSAQTMISTPQQSSDKLKTGDNILLSPSPSPFPFEEMTIPYLRAKIYQSQLGEQTLYRQQGTYNSYLTSYNSDGLKINALLTIPAGEKPPNGFPAIVFVHGYIPPSDYRTTERYVDYVDNLARSGYVVLKIDLRGHGSSEGEAGGGYYSSDYVIDALNAYAALRHSGFVNPDKIGFWGHSMAGNVVLRAIAARPEIPAAVIWGGAGFTYTDLVQYRIQDLSYRPQPSDSARQRKRQELARLYGSPDADNWFWKLVIPTNYLSDFKGGIQLDHAVDDKTVSIEYSRNLNKILNTMNVNHELHEYPLGDHNISNPYFGPAIENTINFYDKFLKN